MTVAKPEVSKGKRLTAIWIIPLVAVAIGVWMVAYTYMTEGPEIMVTFKTASGLAEGKTKVKFRDVEMGMVQEVTLSEDMQSVTALVKMRREALPLLREDTRFWVVTAQIGGGAISGLETILSGAYIQIAPGTSDTKSLNFTGLEEPPKTPADAPGIRLVLLSERSSSVSSGDPVLYHGFKVGRIESRAFDPETKQIRYIIFIDAPYHTLVNSSVRFWDVSGISVSAGAEGLKISTGSLESILLGGVTFGVPPGFEPGGAVDSSTEFRLFPNFDDILRSPHEQRGYYIVSFKQSIKGLLPGAPVEYRGIQIGEVEKIMMEELVNKGLRENKEPQGLPIPVLVYIEPARFALPDTRESLELMEETFKLGVGNGLRATLGTGNLLTGAQVVELDYFDDMPEAVIGKFEGYTTLPTIVTGISGLEQKISHLLDKANKLPLGEITGSINLAVNELNRSMKALRVILENKNMNTIPNELQATLEALRSILEDEGIREIPLELKSTLSAAKFQLQGESTEAYQLNKTLKEVESAARALREFLDTLEKKPESLLRGKTDTKQ
jgi:paraquat-inducible protein B